MMAGTMDIIVLGFVALFFLIPWQPEERWPVEETVWP
jgi:hypothetical protein